MIGDFNLSLLKTWTIHKKKVLLENDIQNTMDYEQFLSLFSNIYKITNHGKYRFQFRLPHRAIILNERLHKWGKIETPLCNWCNINVEYVCRILSLESQSGYLTPDIC